MKPIPVIRVADYKMLRELSKNSINASNAKELQQLTNELDRAIINNDGIIDDAIVRINSHVEIEDIKAKRRMKIQLVLPSLANVKEGKISVLAPLSIALIGFKVNDKIDWDMPAGIKSIKIIAVQNPA